MLNLQYFGHLMWRAESLGKKKKTRCRERLKARGEGDDRGWDSWMASPTRRTWVWASSGSWWWTGKPGVLQLDTTEQLNWLMRSEERTKTCEDRRGLPWPFCEPSPHLHPLQIPQHPAPYPILPSAVLVIQFHSPFQSCGPHYLTMGHSLRVGLRHLAKLFIPVSDFHPHRAYEVFIEGVNVPWWH